MKVDTNYKPYYVHQESKDNKNHIYSFKQNITCQLLIIIHLIIGIKQALKNLKGEKSLEN